MTETGSWIALRGGHMNRQPTEPLDFVRVIETHRSGPLSAAYRQLTLYSRYAH